MLFFSTYANYVLNIVSPYYRRIGDGAFQQVVEEPGLVAQFQPLGGGAIEYRGGNFPVKGGMFRSSFATTNPEMISAMRDNPKYGVEFLAVDDDGIGLERSALYIVPSGDGESLKCLACDKQFKNAQGAAGHRSSPEHVEKVQLANDKLIRRV